MGRVPRPFFTSERTMTGSGKLASSPWILGLRDRRPAQIQRLEGSRVVVVAALEPPHSQLREVAGPAQTARRRCDDRLFTQPLDKLGGDGADVLAAEDRLV